MVGDNFVGIKKGKTRDKRGVMYHHTDPPSTSPQKNNRKVLELFIKLAFVAAFVGGGALLLSRQGEGLSLTDIGGLSLMAAAIAGIEIRRAWGGGGPPAALGGALIVVAASMMGGCCAELPPEVALPLALIAGIALLLFACDDQ